MIKNLFFFIIFLLSTNAFSDDKLTLGKIQMTNDLIEAHKLFSSGALNDNEYKLVKEIILNSY